MRISPEQAKVDWLKKRVLRNNLQIKFMSLDSDINRLERIFKNSGKLTPNLKVEKELRSLKSAQWILKRQLQQLNRDMKDLQLIFIEPTNQITF